MFSKCEILCLRVKNQDLIGRLQICNRTGRRSSKLTFFLFGVRSLARYLLSTAAADTASDWTSMHTRTSLVSEGCSTLWPHGDVKHRGCSVKECVCVAYVSRMVSGTASCPAYTSTIHCDLPGLIVQASLQQEGYACFEQVPAAWRVRAPGTRGAMRVFCSLIIQSSQIRDTVGGLLLFSGPW